MHLILGLAFFAVGASILIFAPATLKSTPTSCETPNGQVANCPTSLVPSWAGALGYFLFAALFWGYCLYKSRKERT